MNKYKDCDILKNILETLKLEGLKIRNFRGYMEEVYIKFENFTTFVGKNDAGKSTILEALEIFFNNKLVACEREDLSVSHKEDDKCIEITCIFSFSKKSILIDTSSTTTLKQEYLLNDAGFLEIKKVFKVTTAKPKPITFIVCNHPTKKYYNDLLTLKIKDLRNRAKDLNVPSEKYDARSSVSLRQVIWSQCDDLKLSITEIPVDKEDSKKIYTQLESFLPVYALFQSDRDSSDSDREIVDPMKIAVKKALQELEPELQKIKDEVRGKVIETANKTLDKLTEMNSDLASKLVPEFKSEPNFDSLFKLTINSDDNIPMNKRGSGVRRLVLLSFFRAEAERQLSEDEKNNSIIYAFEEPETSQHPLHQRLLVEAFLEIAQKHNAQVIMTTHTPAICGLLPLDSLRLVENENKRKIVKYDSDEVYEKIAEMLGVLPEVISKDAKGILLVEGKDEFIFFKHLNKVLKENNEIEKTFDEAGIVLTSTGGCDNLKYWITKRVIHKFNIPWAIFLDSDKMSEDDKTKNMEFVSKNKSKGIKAHTTRKREIENYLHPDLFKEKIRIDDYCDVKKIIEKKVLSRNWHKMNYNQIIETQKYIDDNGNIRYELNEVVKDILSMV